MTENLSDNPRFSRTIRVIGEDGLSVLRDSNIIVFGLGGVGGHAAESLARAGIGRLTILDRDVVEESNMNRQLCATLDTIGMPKSEALKARLAQAAPDCEVTSIDKFYLPENADEINLYDYDYIVDCIDNVTAKLELIERATKCGVPIICCMGTGNKLNPCDLTVTDIYKTSGCPLAKVVRSECRKRGIGKLKVVYSTETPVSTGERTPGSVSFVPGVAGMIMASEVVKDLIAASVKEQSE